MGDNNNNNNNNNNNSGEGNGNQNNNQNVQNNNQNTNQNNNSGNSSVNAEEIRTKAQAEFLKSLGFDDVDSLKDVISKQKKAEQENMTDLQKKESELTETTKQLAQEKKARLISDAKVAAFKMGAKPGLVDDLVTVAISKVTKDKDVMAVMAEIKDGDNGSVYFGSKEDEDDSTNNGSETRKRVKRNQNKNKGSNNTDDGEGKERKHAGTMAERLLANRKKVTGKSSYFTR